MYTLGVTKKLVIRVFNNNDKRNRNKKYNKNKLYNNPDIRNKNLVTLRKTLV